ncbi:MAG: sugar-binding protein [Oscillospiraceae bacterium]|jgi:putative multiple sugar transport system substrate-binding protein|nr:sugar-binding protein [Oscillospiraceae bacterium]
MKKLLAMVLALALVGCMAGAALAEGKVGVAMPTQSLQRWNQDGSNMKDKLEAAGYEVDLQYANNEIATQVSQLENMILGGANVLVVASIDGKSLGTVLADAKAAGIPVIAYDRLLMETDAVSYYATFDNYMVGQIQGKYLEEQLGLAELTAENPVNVEFVGGSPDDNNALYFFQGAYDVIAPYIESGVVKVPSGQTEFTQIATPAWDSANSQARMDNLIAAHYSDGAKLDAVLCSNDSTALGVTNSLINAGFEEFPLITGQDCDVANTKNIIKGYQSMSVFKDTRILADNVVVMIEAILKGEEVPVNDTETYDNGVFVVPTFLSAPVFADAGNYKELLIDSGYYAEADLAD